MPSVIHIIVGLEVGGAELALRRLIASFPSGSEYRHKVVSLTSIGAVGGQLQASGVSVRALGMQAAWQAPVMIWRLVCILRQERPNVVQTWMYHADLLGGLAARLVGCKNVVWGIRNTELAGGSSRATAGIRWMCAKLSRWIPRTIVCVATASQRLHIALGYDAARMVVVANGFDLGLLKSTPQQVNELRRVCGFVAEDLVIGTVGRFNAAKDQQNFVRAAGLVVRQFPDIKFVMVGRGCDASNAELAGWLMASGVAGCTVLLGERGDVPVCLAAMDVFCLPSRAEGFPNVVGEAMAMRRPCVVTDVGDAASLVGDCGTVVAKESARSLADGLNKMLSLSGDERDAVGARARARIESNFSMVQTRLQFQAIYDAAMRAENRNQEGKT